MINASGNTMPLGHHVGFEAAERTMMVVVTQAEDMISSTMPLGVA
jgi:hypothetical protein